MSGNSVFSYNFENTECLIQNLCTFKSEEVFVLLETDSVIFGLYYCHVEFTKHLILIR